MGYILPINVDNQYVYNQVQAQKAKNPFILKPIEKVIIEQKDREEKKKHYKNPYAKSEVFSCDDFEIDQEIIDAHIAEITGKGQLFNEII